jgi:hypothetical protein
MNAAITFTLALVVLVACAKNDPEKKILEAAKRDSVAYCSKGTREGCEFSIVKTPDGWGVMAKPITRSEDGQRAHIPGLWHSYSYDEEGNLRSEAPGL